MKHSPKSVCGAQTRRGGVCGQRAGWSTGHVGHGRCARHGGNSPSGIVAAERQRAEESLSQAVATFGLATDIDPVEALAGELARVNGSCAWLSDRVRAQDPDALLSSESGRALLDQYRAERDRLVRVSKACIDADIGQRTVRLKEQTTDLINAVLIASLTDLGHDPSDPRVRRIIAKHLGAAAGNPVLELLPGGQQ